MPMFSHLSPGFGGHTIRAVCKTVVARANDLHLATTPWSLAELQLDDADYAWLREWARLLDPQTTEQWLLPKRTIDSSENQWQLRGAIGTVLLVFAAEYARRALPCQDQWLVPVADNYQAETAALLFTRQEPSAAYLSALAIAAQLLRLRTIPGLDLAKAEHFNEFLSLQYGFTEAAIDYGLTKWVLEIEPSPAIQRLLDEQYGSKSFRIAWMTLRAYQRGIILNDSLKAMLAGNPWLLPSWLERALDTLPAATPQVPSVPTVSAPAVIVPAQEGNTVATEVVPPVVSQAVASVRVASPLKPANAAADLFAACTPFGGMKTILKAVRMIFQRARENELLGHPWSLAELCLTDYDYIWLRAWVKRLDALTLQACQKGPRSFRRQKSDEAETHPATLTLSAGVGLLLLLWMTETARRQAVEGELWPVLAADSFQPDTAELLFQRNLPTTFFRQLVQSAAREAGLRHAFDDAHAQYYLNTAYLQFGFTYRGMQNRLPEWLSGAGTTLSIQALLDPMTGSESFQACWESLRDFRQGNLTAAQVRARIDKNPWVLPEWTDELLAQAQRKIVSAGIATVTASDADAEPTFLTPPVLGWNAAETPYFRCQFRLDCLEKIAAPENAYTLQIGGKHLGQLLRQSDGQYLPTFGLDIRLPLQPARISASLRRPDGTAAAVQELELWPEEEDIIIFKMPSGERLPDAYQTPLKITSEYALLLTSDLVLDPSATDYFRQTNMQLCRLAKGWSPDVKVLLAGEVFWEPLLTLNADKPLPAWVKEVYPFDLKDVVRLGQSLHFKITHPAEVSIRYVRCDGRAVAFSNGMASHVQAGPILLGPTQTSAALKLQIGANHGGERQRIAQSLKLKVIGAAHLANLGWQVLSGDQGLTTDEAVNDSFRILPPKQWGKEKQETKLSDWFLLEGERPIRCLKTGTSPLGRCAGWGDAVTLRYGTYNSDQAVLWIARSISHPGLVREVECDELPGGSRLLRIRLRQTLEPGPEHAVVWWDATGELVTLTPDSFGEVEGEMWWMCELPATLTDYFAVAVSWRGTRLGATWKDETQWGELLPDITSTNPRQTACLLRWFHLPVLHPLAFPAMRSLCEAYAVEFLSAWSSGKGWPEGLCAEPATQDWYVALRKLLRQWQPTPETAEAILMQLSEVTVREELAAALPLLIGMLTEVDPVLCGKLVKAWKILSPQTSFVAIGWQIAGCSNSAGYWKAKANLLTAAHAATGLPETFIENGIMKWAAQIVQSGKIAALHELNVALGSQVDVIRKLIALKMLEIM